MVSRQDLCLREQIDPTIEVLSAVQGEKVTVLWLFPNHLYVKWFRDWVRVQSQTYYHRLEITNVYGTSTSRAFRYCTKYDITIEFREPGWNNPEWGLRTKDVYRYVERMIPRRSKQ